MIAFEGRPRLYRVRKVPDQVYSRAGNKPRFADLYLPENVKGKVPVIIWVHGGGWRFGDRCLAPDLSRFFAERGFAMVSFDYRLSEEAIFPAPVQDTKTVIRWVRSIATQYSLDSENIGLWGSSAGAHLAACAALSSEHEFITEEHPEIPSAVSAVVDGYGPTDLTQIDRDRQHAPSAPADVESITVPNLLPAEHPDSFESRLLGEPVSATSSAAAYANPITYVHSNAPPFFLLHGLHDPLIPYQQSEMLFNAFRAAGTDATFLTCERLGHGFFNRSDLDSVHPGNVHVYATCHGHSGEFAMELRHTPFGFDMVEKFFRWHLCKHEPATVTSAASSHEATAGRA